METIEYLSYPEGLNSKVPALFLDLSQHEQEVVSAGGSISRYSLFLQFRKEMSFAKSQLNISEYGKNVFITQESGSMFWEFSIGINIS